MYRTVYYPTRRIDVNVRSSYNHPSRNIHHHNVAAAARIHHHPHHYPHHIAPHVNRVAPSRGVSHYMGHHMHIGHHGPRH